MTSSAITRDEMKQWLEALIQDFWLGRRESHEPIMKAILAELQRMDDRTLPENLEGIEKAKKVLDTWLNHKVIRHNQDKWLELISVVDSVDDANDILEVLAVYLGVKHG